MPAVDKRLLEQKLAPLELWRSYFEEYFPPTAPLPQGARLAGRPASRLPRRFAAFSVERAPVRRRRSAGAGPGAAGRRSDSAQKKGWQGGARLGPSRPRPLGP